jgi:hypothetical protein
MLARFNAIYDLYDVPVLDGLEEVKEQGSEQGSKGRTEPYQVSGLFKNESCKKTTDQRTVDPVIVGEAFDTSRSEGSSGAIRQSHYTMLRRPRRAGTHLMAPPVKATENIMTTKRMNPKPIGARGVSRCFSAGRQLHPFILYQGR